MKKIFIRAGHTNTAKGAVGILDEREVNKEYSKLLYEKLKLQGFEVDYWVGEGDKISNLKKGVDLANSMDSDLFISCHANAFDGSANGCEVVEYRKTKLGELIAKNQANALGIKNRGSKQNKNLYELKHTKMKAIINEICFIDNKEDCQAYKNNKMKAIESIVQSICEYYNMEYKVNNIDNEKKLYKVQVGAFSNEENAMNQANKLKQKGYDAYVV